MYLQHLVNFLLNFDLFSSLTCALETSWVLVKGCWLGSTTELRSALNTSSFCCSTIIVGNLVPTDRLYLSICCSTLIVGNLVVWWVRKIDYIGWKSCDIKVLNPLLLCFFCMLFQQILSLLSTLSVYLAQQMMYRNQQISLW